MASLLARGRRAAALPLLLLCGLLVSPSGRAEDAPKIAGQDVPPPKRIRTVLPEFPAEAQAQGLHGIVILELLIDVDGRVADAKVVRSVPPFDTPALEAVKKWEYEVTKFEGKPVRVTLTVPITFALKLPDVSRQEGIPELRQGATPAFPKSKGGGKVVADITLDPDGRIADALVTEGEGVWADAVLQAVRTWRFAAVDEPATYTFRLEVEFAPARADKPPSIAMRLSGLRKTPLPDAASASAAAPAPVPTEPAPAPSAPPPTAPPVPSAPQPAPAALATPPPPGPVVAAPVPIATPAPAVKPVPTATPPPGAKPPQRASQPSTEVLSVPPPPQPVAAPTPPPQPGVSAVDGVALAIGVPDLVTGRRPAAPPLARLASEYGQVEVRFAVNAAGNPAVLAMDGPALLKPAAEVTVASWGFRRTTADRLYLTALIAYRAEGAQATVGITPPESRPAPPAPASLATPPAAPPVAPPVAAPSPAPTPAGAPNPSATPLPLGPTPPPPVVPAPTPEPLATPIPKPTPTPAAPAPTP